jgi:hypothetical protein
VSRKRRLAYVVGTAVLLGVLTGWGASGYPAGRTGVGIGWDVFLAVIIGAGVVVETGRRDR